MGHLLCNFLYRRRVYRTFHIPVDFKIVLYPAQPSCLCGLCVHGSTLVVSPNPPFIFVHVDLPNQCIGTKYFYTVRLLHQSSARWRSWPINMTEYGNGGWGHNSQFRNPPQDGAHYLSLSYLILSFLILSYLILSYFLGP